MASRLSAKLAAIGATGALAATALVAAATGAANADSTTVDSQPLTYDCSTLLGNFTATQTYHFPSTVVPGATNAFTADITVDAAGTTILNTAYPSPGPINATIVTTDQVPTAPVQSSFELGSTGVSGTMVISNVPTPPAGQPYTFKDVPGTLGTVPSTVSGAQTLAAPTELDLRAIGLDNLCSLDSASTANAAIGSVNVGTPAPQLTAKAGAGDTIAVTAQAAPNTPGTGSVTYSFTGKVAKVKTVTVKTKHGKKKVKKTAYVTKKFKKSVALNSQGQATISLAKDKLKKGKYSVTLTWDDQSTVVSVKIA